MFLSESPFLDLFWALMQFLVLAVVVLQCVKTSRNLSASSLHGILSFTVALIILLPLVHLALPKFNLQILESPVDSFFSDITLDAESKGVLLLLIQSFFWMGMVYAVCSSLLAISLLPKLNVTLSSDSTEVQILNRVCERLAINKIPKLGYSEAVLSPCTWGHVSPVIALPKNAALWKVETLERVLHHECSHIRRNDWAFTLTVNFLRRLLWFIPCLGSLSRALHWYSELACDDNVVQYWKREDYADDLLQLALSQKLSPHMPSFNVVNQLNYGEAYARIDAVLDPTRVRAGTMKPVYVFALLSVLAAVFFASIRIELTTEPFEFGSVTNASAEQGAKSELPELNKQRSITEGDTQEKSTVGRSVALLSVNLENDSILFLNRAELERDKSDAEQRLIDDDFVDVINPVLNIEASLTQEVLPEYPRAMLKRGKEGIAVVGYSIDARGVPFNVGVISSQPHASFGRAAAEAIKQYRYLPQILNGRAVIVEEKFETFQFKLED